MIFDDPLSVQNNNPGNIRNADGSFKSFDTPDAGLAALREDLLTKVNGKSPAMASKFGDNYTPTIRSLISTWAPNSENDTKSYIDHVSKSSGIDPDTQLAAADIDKIVPGMIKMEGGQAAQDHFSVPQQTMTDAPDPKAAAYARADQLLAQKWTNPKSNEPSPAEKLAETAKVLGRQAEQGGTFGFADEIQDLIGAGIAKADPNNDASFGDLWNDARGMSKKELADDAQNHPMATIAGNIGGGILTGGAVAGGVKSLGAKLAPEALETVINAAKASPKTTAFITGTGSGGLYGAGTGDGDLGNRAVDAGIGALIGGPLGIAGYGVAKGASKIGSYVADKASPYISPLISKTKNFVGGILGDEVPQVADDMIGPAANAAQTTIPAVDNADINPMKLAGILDEDSLANLQQGRALPMTAGDRTQNVNTQRMEQIAAENGSQPMLAARAQQQQAARQPFKNILGGDVSSDPVDLRSIEQSSAEDAAKGLRSSFDTLKGQERAAWNTAKDTGEGVGINGQNVTDDLVGGINNFLADNQYRKGDIPDLDKHLDELKGLVSYKVGSDGQPEITSKLKDLENWKTRLNGIIGDTPMDKTNTKRILGNISRQYDNFTTNLADSAIVNGDDTAINAFKNARSLSKQRFGFQDSDTAVKRILDNRDLSGEQLVNTIFGADKLAGKGDNGRLVETMLAHAGDQAPAMQDAIKQGIMAKAFRRSVTQTADPSDISQNLISFDKMRNEIGNVINKKEIFGTVFNDNEQQYMRQMYDDLKLVASKQKGAVNNSSTGAYAADMIAGLGKVLNNPIFSSIPGIGTATSTINQAMQRQAAGIVTRKAEKGLDEFIINQINNMDARPAFYGALSANSIPVGPLMVEVRPSDKERK